MSMCYWGICGYGISNFEEMVSEEKINQIANQDDYEIVLSEYASEYYNGGCFDITDDGEGTFYLLYYPSFPFDLTDTEKQFTCKDDIILAMYASVKHILLDDITPGCFKQRMKWVSTYGASC